MAKLLNIEVELKYINFTLGGIINVDNEKLIEMTLLDLYRRIKHNR